MILSHVRNTLHMNGESHLRPCLDARTPLSMTLRNEAENFSGSLVIPNTPLEDIMRSVVVKSTH
jgi:hypothetical protein